MPIYVYGVVDGKENRNFGRIGIGKRKVGTVKYRDISALISNTSKMILEPSLENARAHEDVSLEVMKDSAVIPMGFGTIAEDRDSLIEILKRGYGNFKEGLERIKRKVQIDLKVSWNREKLFIDILRENEEIRDLWRRVKESEKPIEEERIKLGKLVHSELEEKRESYKKEILSELSSLSEGPPEENKLTSEDIIANLSFLVEKDEEDKFYRRADELDEDHEGRLKIVTVGPLPPYNFTKMKIRRIDFKSIDSARRNLNLGKEATVEEIESSYRNLVHKYHPDINPDPRAEERFKKIQESYDLLQGYCKNFPSSRYSFRKSDVEKTVIVVEGGG